MTEEAAFTACRTRTLARVARPGDGDVFVFGPASLVARRAPTFEEWQALGVWLQTVEGALQWWIGDWLNLGEGLFGERASQAMDATGWQLKTLLQYRWVADRVEAHRREPRLSFFHHREVADLNPEEQTRWLARAVDGEDGAPWGVDRLRVALKAATRGDKTIWVVVEARDADDAAALVLRLEAEGRRVKVR